MTFLKNLMKISLSPSGKIWKFCFYQNAINLSCILSSFAFWARVSVCVWISKSLFFNINFPLPFESSDLAVVRSCDSTVFHWETHVTIVSLDRNIKGRPRSGDAAFNLIIVHLQALKGAGGSVCRKLKWGGLSLCVHFDQRGWIAIWRTIFSPLDRGIWGPKLLGYFLKFCILLARMM